MKSISHPIDDIVSVQRISKAICVLNRATQLRQSRVKYKSFFYQTSTSASRSSVLELSKTLLRIRRRFTISTQKLMLSQLQTCWTFFLRNKKVFHKFAKTSQCNTKGLSFNTLTQWKDFHVGRLEGDILPSLDAAHNLLPDKESRFPLIFWEDFYRPEL